jgi:hypothetical protein
MMDSVLSVLLSLTNQGIIGSLRKVVFEPAVGARNLIAPAAVEIFFEPPGLLVDMNR